MLDTFGMFYDYCVLANAVGFFSSGMYPDRSIKTQTVYDYGSVMHYNKFAYGRRNYLAPIQVNLQQI